MVLTQFQPYKIPGGFMFAAPHAKTQTENLAGGTISSCYLMTNGNECCLIDTGIGEEIKVSICQLLRELKCDLKYIILTHDHYDHVANATEIKKLFGGQIVAHEKDIPLIEDPLLIFNDQKMQELYGGTIRQAFIEKGLSEKELIKNKEIHQKSLCFPQKVDIAINNSNSRFKLGNTECIILSTPGHSPGSISIYFPDYKSVLIGDLSFWINPCRVYPIGDAAKTIASLKKVMQLDLEFIGPGHNLGIFGKENCFNYLQDLLKKMEQLEKQILLKIKNYKALTVDDLTKAIFPIFPQENYSPIPENSIYSFLYGLREKGEVKIVWENGIPLWTVN